MRKVNFELNQIPDRYPVVDREQYNITFELFVFFFVYP